MNRKLVAIVALSLLVRVDGVLLFPIEPLYDAAGYHAMATRLARTGELRLSYQSIQAMVGGEMVAWRSPGYPGFLAGLYRLGFSWQDALLAHAVLGALTTLLVFLLGNRIGGKRVGLLAALFHALSLHSLFYTVQLLSETLTVALVASFLVALVYRRYPWAGVALGAAVLVRPACVFFLPAFPLAVWLQEHRIRPLLMGTALTVLTVLPWVARNVAMGVGPTLSTSDGYNLYVGNNPRATSGGWDWLSGDDVLARKLPEAAMSRTMKREAVAWIMAHPARYLTLCVLRFGRLFGSEPNPKLNALFKKPGLPLQLPSMLLGVFGLGFAVRTAWKRRHHGYTSLLLCVGCYALGISATFCQMRFQEVIGPAIVVFAASACVWLLERQGADLPTSNGQACLRPPQTPGPAPLDPNP